MRTSLYDRDVPETALGFIATNGTPFRGIQTGDFSIDLGNRTVTLRGQDISLNQAELDLLVFLTTHRRKLVTPRTLLVTRWANQKATREDFLPLLLSLRKKLAAAVPLQRYIRLEFCVLCRFESGVK